MRGVGAAPLHWPPDYLDEVATRLAKLRPTSVDSKRSPSYTLVAALTEATATFELGFDRQAGKSVPKSLLDDVSAAVNARGPRVQHSTPAADPFLKQIEHLGIDKSPSPDGERHAAALRDELQAASVASDALLDVVDAIRDPDTDEDTISDRLAVLEDILELQDRSVYQTVQTLSGILDDSVIWINQAQRRLGNEVRDDAIANPTDPDESAGLSEHDRLELARRFAELQLATGHQVAWIVYENAVLRGLERRLRVGPVEFFDGPNLIAELRQTGKGHVLGELPSELLTPEVDGGIDHWQDWPDLSTWVAVRVDLGTTPHSDPLRVARQQAEALVQLAALNRRETSWEPRTDYLIFIDNRWAGTGQQGPTKGTPAIADYTDEAIRSLPPEISQQLPVDTPELSRLLEAIGSINRSASSDAPDYLLQDIRVIQLIARECRMPWTNFLETNATHWAFNKLRSGIVNTTLNPLEDYTLNGVIQDSRTKRSRITSPSSTPGMIHLRADAAFDMIQPILDDLPAHTVHTRRLRRLAQHVSTATAFLEALNRGEAEFNSLVQRAARYRNGLAHGTAAPPIVAETVRQFVTDQARIAAGAALSANLEGDTIQSRFDERRQNYKLWKKGIRNATDLKTAVFPDP